MSWIKYYGVRQICACLNFDASLPGCCRQVAKLSEPQVPYLKMGVTKTHLAECSGDS